MRFAVHIVLMVAVFFQTAHAEGKLGLTVRLDRETHLWQLQANRVPLPVILDEVQRESGMVIHYSVLPEAAVTATCAAGKLSALLKCLLGESTGLVFGQINGVEPKEAWILGSSAAKLKSDCTTSVSDKPQNPATYPDSVRLYEDTQNIDPRRRAEAIYTLAASDEKAVDAILRAAMTDSSALVRGQAFGGWVRRHGSEAAESELQEAILDTDASVRMRAIELTSDPGLLSQGLHDIDAMVRQLAQAKLDELTH